MATFTMALAKRDFENGYLTGYRLDKAAITEGWHVLLRTGENATSWPLVDARNHQPRLFRTLDAAVKAIEEIGFKVLTLG